MARFSQMAPNLYVHCSFFVLFCVANQRNTVSMVVPLVWWTVLLILWILAAVYFYVRSLFDEHPDIYEKWTPVIAGKLGWGRFLFRLNRLSFHTICVTQMILIIFRFCRDYISMLNIFLNFFHYYLVLSLLFAVVFFFFYIGATTSFIAMKNEAYHSTSKTPTKPATNSNSIAKESSGLLTQSPWLWTNECLRLRQF